MTLVDPAILKDRPEVDAPTFPQAAWRTAAVFAAPVPQGDDTRPGRTTVSPSSLDAAYRASLQEYAAFVLDQEAEYCQE